MDDKYVCICACVCVCLSIIILWCLCPGFLHNISSLDNIRDIFQRPYMVMVAWSRKRFVRNKPNDLCCALQGRRKRGGRGRWSRPSFCAFHLTFDRSNHMRVRVPRQLENVGVAWRRGYVKIAHERCDFGRGFKILHALSYHKPLHS